MNKIKTEVVVMRTLFWVMFAVSLSLPLVGVADETQTASATLETVISLIQGNRYIPEKHVEVLTGLMAAALGSEVITPEQALALLDTVGWDELSEGDRLGVAVRALELALVSLTTEKVAFEDVIVALREAVSSGKLSPLIPGGEHGMAVVGVLMSLVEAGQRLDPELVAKVEEALSAGVVPGHVVEVVKRLSREGADEASILAALDDLIKNGGEEAHGHGAGGKCEGKKQGNGEKQGGKGQGNKGGSSPGKGSGNCGKGGGEGKDDHGSHGHGKGKKG